MGGFTRVVELDLGQRTTMGAGKNGHLTDGLTNQKARLDHVNTCLGLGVDDGVRKMQDLFLRG